MRKKTVRLGKSDIQVPRNIAQEAQKLAKRNGRAFVIQHQTAGEKIKVVPALADIPSNWEIVGKIVNDGVVFTDVAMVLSECDRIGSILGKEAKELERLKDFSYGKGLQGFKSGYREVSRKHLAASTGLLSRAFYRLNVSQIYQRELLPKRSKREWNGAKSL